VHDQTRLEHQGVRDHRVVLGVGVLLDVEVLLDDPAGVGEEGPEGADRRPELLQCVVLVGGDRDDLRVRDRDLRLERGQVEVLLVFLGTEVAAGEREDQRVAALQLAERADGAGVVGQRVVREHAAGDDVRTHEVSTGAGSDSPHRPVPAPPVAPVNPLARPLVASARRQDGQVTLGVEAVFPLLVEDRPQQTRTG
jgi:hypothetical protein